MPVASPYALPDAEAYTRLPSKLIRERLLHVTTAGISQRLPGYTVETAAGKGYSLMAVANGVVTISCDSDSFTAQRGDIVLTDKSRDLRMTSETGWSAIWLEMDGPPARVYFEAVTRGNHFVLRPGCSDRVRELMLDVIDRVRRNEADADLRIALQLTTALTLLAESNGEKDEDDDHMMQRMLRKIASDIANPPSVAEMAEEANLSKSHFIRVFNRVTGVTPKQYILALRADAAKEMLAASELSLREVGRRIGYNSESMFCTMFGRTTGMTPGEYRSLYGKIAPISPQFLLRRVYEAIIAGDVDDALKRTEEAIAADCGYREVLNAMIDAMGTVGTRFDRREIELTVLLNAAKAMKQSVAFLKRNMPAEIVIGKAIIGTVRGDMHDIGKNLVVLMLEGAGFEVIDLGVDVSPESFVQCCRENPDARIVMLSALLSSSRDFVRQTVEALNREPFRKELYVMIGGASMTDEFAHEIHADAYTENATSAARLAKDYALAEKKEIQ